MPTGTAQLIQYPSSSTVTAGGSTTQIWTIWNSNHTVTSSATLSNDVIWTAWTNGTSSITVPQIAQTSTGNSTVIWGAWNGTQEVKLATAEERARLAAERQRANEEYQARQMALQAETSAAQARALRLLKENLDAKQKADLDANGFFELETFSKNGERRKYRIHRKWSANIQQVDDSGKRIKTLCIHPRESTPVEDSMLAQKLMLEGGAEEDLLRIANHS